MIIVDNLVDNFKLQQNNGLPIKTWTDDISDKELIHLGNFLKFLYEKKVILFDSIYTIVFTNF